MAHYLLSFVVTVYFVTLFNANGHSTSSGYVLQSERTRGKYVGCHKDQGNRGLKGFHGTSTENTIESCIALCRGGNFVYAGAQARVHCFCDNVLNPTLNQKIDGSKCNRACRGNITQMCGGVWANSIYETGLEVYVVDENGHYLPESQFVPQNYGYVG